MASDSIFDLGEQLNYQSPFGNWLPSTHYNPARIDVIAVEPASASQINAANIRPTSTPGQRTRYIKITVSVRDDTTNTVEVEMDGVREVARFDSSDATRKLINYSCIKKVDIPIPFDNVDKTVVAWLTDTFYKNQLDTKSRVVTVRGKEGVESAPTGCACHRDLTAEELKKIAPRVSTANIKKHLDGINQACSTFNIQTCLRKGHFIAQLLHESINFSATKELGVKQTAYGGFIGRGLIQLTFRENYEAYGKFVKVDFVSNLAAKQKLEQSPHAGKSAGWFWAKKGRNLNDLADDDDFILITQSINGGFNGYDDRLKNLQIIAKAFNSMCNQNPFAKVYKLIDSGAYNKHIIAFAWGLWHDPDLGKDSKKPKRDKKFGCTKSKEQALLGYKRVEELLAGRKVTSKNFKINKMKDFESLVKNGRVNILEAAQSRIEALSKGV